MKLCRVKCHSHLRLPFPLIVCAWLCFHQNTLNKLQLHKCHSLMQGELVNNLTTFFVVKICMLFWLRKLHLVTSPCVVFLNRGTYGACGQSPSTPSPAPPVSWRYDAAPTSTDSHPPTTHRREREREVWREELNSSSHHPSFPLSSSSQRMNSRTRTSLPDGFTRSSRPRIRHSSASLLIPSSPSLFSTTSFLLPFHLFLSVISRVSPSHNLPDQLDVTGAALSSIFTVRQRIYKLRFVYLRSRRTRNVDSAAARDDDDPIRDQHTVEDSDVSQTPLFFVLSFSFLIKRHPHRPPPTLLTNPHPLQKHVFYLERFYSWHIQKWCIINCQGVRPYVYMCTHVLGVIMLRCKFVCMCVRVNKCRNACLKRNYFFLACKSQWSRSRMKRKAMALMGNGFFPHKWFFVQADGSLFLSNVHIVFCKTHWDNLRKNGLRTTQELVLLVSLNEAHSHGSKELTCMRLDHWSKGWCICMNVWLSPRGLDGPSSTSSVVPLEGLY